MIAAVFFNFFFKDIYNLPARPIGARTPNSGLGVFDTTEQAVGARWIDIFNFKVLTFCCIFRPFWRVFPRFWTVLERFGPWFWPWKQPEETGI